MAEDEFPKTPQLPRGPDRLPTPADFRSGAGHRVRVAELEAPDNPVPNEVGMPSDRRAEANTEATRNQWELQQQPTQKALDEVATLIQSLTYGEMMELSETMWKGQPEGSPVTQENLPALLHRWAISRSVTAHDASEEMPSD
jgi:hypothetical protein